MRLVYLAASAAISLVIAATAMGAATANLVQNPGAEIGRAAKDPAMVVRPSGWKTTGNFTAVLYGASGGFPEATISTAINGGNKFFAGGPNNARSSARQTIGVSGLAARIDRGSVQATLSGRLGGFASQQDLVTVEAIFRAGTGQAGGSKLGSLRIGPVTAAERGNRTRLLERKKTAPVPEGTRSIELVMTATRPAGGYNDGYADNISLTLGFKTPPTS